MTKEELNSIHSINKEIKMWKKELEKLQCQSLIRGQQLTGMPSCQGSSDKVGDMATTMVEIQTVINGLLAKIQLQRKATIEYISELQDSNLRQIVFYRAVSCMNWEQIARELGPGHTQDAIKKKYYRHFKKCP